MQISAKFQTVCPTCRHRIAMGERVEWERGKPAVHVKCQPAQQQELPKTARRAKAPAAQPADNCGIRDTAGFYDFDGPDSYSP